MSAFFVPTRFTWRFGGSVVGHSSNDIGYAHILLPLRLLSIHFEVVNKAASLYIDGIDGIWLFDFTGSWHCVPAMPVCLVPWTLLQDTCNASTGALMRLFYSLGRDSPNEHCRRSGWYIFRCRSSSARVSSVAEPAREPLSAKIRFQTKLSLHAPKLSRLPQLRYFLQLSPVQVHRGRGVAA